MSDQTRAPQGDPAEPPLVLKGPAMQFPYMPSPKKLVFGYDPDEFEEFVKEWVPALQPEYVRVERQGGSGDHGIDVAAYRSAQGLEGPWDNYQCKRYKSALNWSTAAGEIRKMFAGVVLRHFVLPTQYVFVAPAFARNLRTALAKPAQTRAKFLQGWPPYGRQVQSSAITSSPNTCSPTCAASHGARSASTCFTWT
ncbi:restriction endonuclease [Streptomyces sp. NPDC057486]|uniref:restriction endonuclease n=1 Tax=Streptomyces sp. NPDC057486 TaxID=3346145 RepID=UPI0036804386